MLPEENGRLSCDSNLVALVCMLFVGGWFLWSSLLTGVQTTRVVVRMARDGCCESGKRRVGQIGFRRMRKADLLLPSVLPSLEWAKILFTFGRSAGKRVRRPSSQHNTQLLDTAATLGPQWSGVRLALTLAVPYRSISRVWGLATRLPLPFYFLKWIFYQGWATAFNCKLEEMRFPLASYPSLSDFFLRPLRDGVRRVDMTPGAMVCPVDGKVLHVTSSPMVDYDKVQLEQVKGLSYSLRELIGDIPQAFKRGEACKGRKINSVVLYLSPGDYHHFHASCEATFTERKHFPGDLLPVKPAFVENVQRLYCVNERVVLNGTWAQGYFGYVAVGALNVGSIEIACEPDLRTNVPGKASGCFQRTYQPPVQCTPGERLGAFHLGSTVVLVFESDEDFELNVSPGDVVEVGQRMDIRAPTETELPSEKEADAPVMMCPPWPAACST